MASSSALARGDELHARHDPGRALEAYLEVLAREPTNYDALWRASREAATLGVLAAGGEARRDWLARSAEYGERAVAVRPGDPEGHFRLAVALGRLALQEGIRRRLELSSAVRLHALAALAIDSAHAGAHHVYGRWHSEVMRLGALERFLARNLLGAGVISEASWQKAEEHLRRAAALEPGRIAHHLELGRLYLDTGRPELARQELRLALELPAMEIEDPLYKQEAQELMLRIR